MQAGSELLKLLDTALHKAENRISLTVTDVPEGENGIGTFLEKAFGAGLRNGLQLSEVQLSLARFPSLARRFLHAPVTDSGHPHVLRLIYDPQRTSKSAA